jgi:hypothetical protein
MICLAVSEYKDLNKAGKVKKRSLPTDWVNLVK